MNYIIALPRHEQPEYFEYIKTERWKTLSAYMKILKWGRCEWCKEKKHQLETHHVSYARLGKEMFFDLMVLCPICHTTIREICERADEINPKKIIDPRNVYFFFVNNPKASHDFPKDIAGTLAMTSNLFASHEEREIVIPVWFYSAFNHPLSEEEIKKKANEQFMSDMSF